MMNLSNEYSNQYNPMTMTDDRLRLARDAQTLENYNINNTVGIYTSLVLVLVLVLDGDGL